MLTFVRILYRFITGAYNAANVPVIGSVGVMDIFLAFLVVSMVISVFWKGARA